MDFTKRSKIKPLKTPDEESIDRFAPHNCMFYILPPQNDVSLKDFEDLAVERLKLLRIFEQASLRHPKLLSDEWKEFIINELNAEGLKYFVRLIKGNGNTEQDKLARRRDYLSHFILRFVYCRSEELRRWFIAREMELFKFKFSSLSSAEVKDFIELYEMGYRPITDEQKNEVRAELQCSTTGNVDSIDFYKVNFLQVLDLVRLRKCFLKAGFAYVSSGDFISIISGHHQQFIEKGLLSHLKLLPEFEDDERIVGIIKGLHTSYVGKDYTVNKDADIPIESLDQLSIKSYPLCMRMCHDSLRKTHHLKHHGRLQYGLFLKGIGVTLEDSLRFWREEMTKNMEPDKFDKGYAYGIRYNYGKEGSRTNWSPWSCGKIIATAPGAQDVAGCPFKLWDSIELRSKLTSFGLNPISVQDVVSYASKGHFQLACGRYFEAVHETRLDEGVSHPNGYFENSQIIMGTRQAKEKSKPNSQMASLNQRKQVQMNKQQEFKRKLEARQKEEKDFDERLWILSQNEEEILRNDTERRERERNDIAEISKLKFDDDDDVEMAQVGS